MIDLLLQETQEALQKLGVSSKKLNTYVRTS